MLYTDCETSNFQEHICYPPDQIGPSLQYVHCWLRSRVAQHSVVSVGFPIWKNTDECCKGWKLIVKWGPMAKRKTNAHLCRLPYCSTILLIFVTNDSITLIKYSHQYANLLYGKILIYGNGIASIPDSLEFYLQGVNFCPNSQTLMNESGWSAGL